MRFHLEELNTPRTWTGVFLVAFCLGIPTGTIAEDRQQRFISGQVVTSDDATPIARALVTCLSSDRSTTTNGSGHFSLDYSISGLVRLVVEAAGFVTDTVTLARSQNTVTVELHRVALELDPVTVFANAPVPPDRSRFDSTTQTSAITIQGADIVNIPGMFEPDVIRAVQLLPGTIAKNDYSISYNVRGGEGDQNLVLLDGVTVFNPSHLGGMFSTFDANAVDRVDFFTGGFPASYPGRLSSVLDVSLRSGRRDGMHGGGRISLLSSKLLFEGPLGPATYLFGARRTYADAVVAAFTRHTMPYYFTDAVSKINLPFASGGSLALTTYWGRDDLDVNVVSETDDTDPSVESRTPIDVVVNWGNRLAGVNFSWPLRRGLFEARASVTDFYTTLAVMPDLARWDNNVRLSAAGFNVTLVPLRKHELHLGAGVERYEMTYDLLSPLFEFGGQPGNYGGMMPLFNNDYRPTIWSAYADDVWTPSWRLKIRPGIRAEHVPEAGFTGIAPRVSFKVFLAPDKAVIGSLGRYHQAVHSLRDQEIPVTVYEFWIGADEFVPVSHSDHGVIGYEQWFGRGLQINVEAYRKTFRNLVIPNSAQSQRDVGNEYRPMEGESWGFDVLLRRHRGRVKGWISYGFNKTERRADGRGFPPAHDRRHTVNVVLSAPGPLGSELGLRWGLGSPLPYTGFNGAWSHRTYRLSQHSFEGGEEEPIAGEINSERFPTYSRLDVGFRWEFEKWGMMWNPYVQIANAYNRQNVFMYAFDYGTNPPTRTGATQVPLFPTFGVEFKW